MFKFRVGLGLSVLASSLLSVGGGSAEAACQVFKPFDNYANVAGYMSGCTSSDHHDIDHLSSGGNIDGTEYYGPSGNAYGTCYGPGTYINDKAGWPPQQDAWNANLYCIEW